MSFRQQLARKIMWWSMIVVERIDRRECPKLMGYSFTFESPGGITFHDNQRGCPMLYLNDSDYDRAWSNS